MKKPEDPIHFAGGHLNCRPDVNDVKRAPTVINNPLTKLNEEVSSPSNLSPAPPLACRAFKPTDYRVTAVISKQVDDRFVKHVMSVVERHIANYRFNAQILARELKVSLRQLFRKFGVLLKITPNVFIRKMRLERAAQLLRDSRLTVLEITYAVGFCDPKYFRNVFRKHFGILPSTYARHYAGRSV